MRLGAAVLGLAAGVLVTACGCPAPSPAVTPTPAERDGARAIDLYDDGKYAEARSILEGLDAAGQATGPLLYRLYFCRAAAGDPAGARQALERSKDALEKATAAGGTLEDWFYLANAYANLERGVDQRKAAVEALTRLDGGKIPQPRDAMGRFQVAKLDQDAGRLDRAATEYRSALAGFQKESRAVPGNVRWARRFLAADALSRGDYAEAATELSAVVALGGAQVADYKGLGVAAARSGRYAEASDAWRQADRLDPANGDDPRYASRLAAIAAELASLPQGAPDGRPWAKLSKEELESVMKAKADEVRAAHEAASKAARDDPGARRAFEAAVASSKPAFVAAGLEYACRGLPIRETAFSQGYAVLIFQQAPWEWPAPPQN